MCPKASQEKEERAHIDGLRKIGRFLNAEQSTIQHIMTTNR